VIKIASFVTLGFARVTLLTGVTVCAHGDVAVITCHVYLVAPGTGTTIAAVEEYTPVELAHCGLAVIEY
jgi:hypothetical protein